MIESNGYNNNRVLTVLKYNKYTKNIENR